MGMTIKDIAKKCGVGVSTVSRALNNHPDINPQTKEMILKAVEQNGFVPNNSARNLKRTDSKTIAIIVKDIDNPFFATMMKIMEQEIHRQNYSFFIHHVGKEQNEVDAALELVTEKRLRGIIFLGGYFKGQKERLARIKVPIVVSTAGLPEVPGKENCSFVTIDNERESQKMTEYLCRCGHRQIAILAGSKDDQNIGKMRLSGYKKALKAAKIPVQNKLIRYLDKESDEYSLENGYRMMKKLIKEEVPFTAVYAISDLMAVGAVRAIAESGKKVPEDCAVAGFDGLDYAAYYNPAVTTIVQPVEEMAKESVNILFKMIENKSGVKGKILRAELKIRQSTTG